MDWDHLRFVLAVADAGGLSAAGRALRVDPGTVGRRLDALEGQLRCKLFHRSRRGLEPTEAGAKLVGHARRIEEEIRTLGLELSAEDRGLGGTVTVTATETLAAGFVAPALPDLRRRHPSISLELVTDIRSLDLGRREADIALRLARPSQGDLKQRRLGTVGYALYASPAYLERHGVPEAGTGGAPGHLLIDWPADYTVIPQVPWLRARMREASVCLRSGSAMARLAAAAAGAGVALLPCLLADSDPRLVRIPSEAPPAQDLWLVTHRDLARVPRVRAAADFLAETARKSAGRLAGTAAGTPSSGSSPATVPQ